MSKRALWLAFGALSVGFVVVSCTGSDGAANFDATGGDGAGGDDPSGSGSSSKAGTKNTGGSDAQAGAGQGEDGGNGSSNGGNGSSNGGQGSGDAGSSSQAGAPGGGTDTNGGQPGGGGDATSGGAPSGNGGTPGGDAGAGGADPGRTPCESSKQCEQGEVCVKPACDKQKEGQCMGAPATPVCGCDGVTYYDGALAIEAEQDVRGQGTCKGETAVTCDGDCKEGLTCGIVELRDGNCETKVGGVCWQLPEKCPEVDLRHYDICGGDTCLSLCEAVQKGAHAVPGGLICPVIN